jgi:hypothetical protein
VTRVTSIATDRVAKEPSTMKSVAAYYVLVAMTSQEQDAHRRRAQHAAAASPRPSLLGRLRSAFGSARPAGSAAEPA